MTSLKDILPLPGYSTVTEATKLFHGCTKQAIYSRIYSGKFRGVVRVGSDLEDQRPMLLIPTAELHRVFNRETQESNAAIQRRQEKAVSSKTKIAEWNKRVKQWARESGQFVYVPTSGVPKTDVVEAYLREHPDDPRPTGSSQPQPASSDEDDTQAVTL